MKPDICRVLASAVGALLAVVLVACGSPDGARQPGKAIDSRSSPQASGADAGVKDEAVSPRSPADRIAQAVEAMYQDFADGDAAAVCAVMSRAVRREIAQSAADRGGNAPASCAGRLSEFMSAAAGTGIRERLLGATVKAVEVDGRAATVTVSLGGRSGEVRLLRERGGWRFGAAPL